MFVNLAIIVSVFALAMAALYRWRGSDYDIRPLAQILFCIPFGVCASWYWWPTISWAALIPGAGVGVIAFLGVTMGHGEYQDLGTYKKKSDPERIDVLFSWLKTKVSGYLYDFIGLTLIGCFFAIPLAATTLCPWFLLSAFSMPVGYAIGRKIYKLLLEMRVTNPPKWFVPTAVGELLTGLFFGAALGVFLVTVLGVTAIHHF